jgi:hypothetical protein
MAKQGVFHAVARIVSAYNHFTKSHGQSQQKNGKILLSEKN